ncbi:MAG: hypothetical protein P8P20_01045, partial [Acidimicrobiales bacterium]|nr:hypothetical protein [Acidimicrobiales bacterium]
MSDADDPPVPPPPPVPPVPAVSDPDPKPVRSFPSPDGVPTLNDETDNASDLEETTPSGLIDATESASDDAADETKDAVGGVGAAIGRSQDESLSDAMDRGGDAVHPRGDAPAPP